MNLHKHCCENLKSRSSHLLPYKLKVFVLAATQHFPLDCGICCCYAVVNYSKLLLCMSSSFAVTVTSSAGIWRGNFNLVLPKIIFLVSPRM
jgi:hypothetical protein